MSDLVKANPTTGQMTFQQMAANAATIDEGQLEKDKYRLIGVPHLITRVTYRPVPAAVKGQPAQRGFVSLEAIIADPDMLKHAVQRGWIPNVDSVEQLLFKPLENIVYNDGGTGIRRRVTATLHHLGLIDVGDVQENDDFDRPWTEWSSFSQSSLQKAEKGSEDKIEVPDITDFSPNSGIFAAHGLRVSEYDAFGQASKTFYLS